jgi:DNA-formamidopyrimidine glycosylase
MFRYCCLVLVLSAGFAASVFAAESPGLDALLGGSGLAQVETQPKSLVFDNGKLIRYTDPRRFGAMLWIDGPEPQHPLLDSLGPEPLSPTFDGEHLYRTSRGRTVSVKEFIMNSRVVVGVGNIYASESLFLAGIRPTRAAGRLSSQQYRALAAAITETLEKAIRAGGSSLRDYVQTSGELGYFQVDAFCYDREGLVCRRRLQRRQDVFRGDGVHRMAFHAWLVDDAHDTAVADLLEPCDQRADGDVAILERNA